MHFVSIEWVFWLAGTVAAFWLAPARWRHYTLAAITLLFLLVHAPVSALFLCLFALLTFFATATSTVSGPQALVISAAIVAVLGYYKVLVSASPEDLLRETIIPLGLSYYSFRCVHYIIERYKGGLPDHGFRDFAFYIFFIPTIVMGPIHRFPAFYRDLRRHRWDGRMISEGLERILYGYVKITFLANYLVSGEFARFIGSLEGEPQALVFYLEIVRGGLNLYLQFSGFSDVAIGFARLLGFRVMENFDWPYFKSNISDFWQSWHISLTSWCREYVYTTVFSISRSPALGAFMTLIVIGLWHEVSVRYILWGAYHGLGIVIWQQFQKVKKQLPAIENPMVLHTLRLLSIVGTVHFVWIGFTIVRQPDLASAWHVISTVLLFWM